MLIRPGLSLDLLFLLVAWSLVLPPSAWAYIDPMSGSVLLQALAAGGLALGWTLRRYWRQFVDSLHRLPELLRKS